MEVAAHAAVKKKDGHLERLATVSNKLPSLLTGGAGIVAQDEREIYPRTQSVFAHPHEQNKMRAFTVGLGLLLMLLVMTTSRAEDWPGWRGPTGQGISNEKTLPVRWGGQERRNVRWQAFLPGVRE